MLAEVFMTLIWCGELKEKLSHAGIVNKVLNRFVDDITMIQQIIPEGIRLINGKIISKEDKVDEDKLVPGDKRTMMIIKEIADSIDDDITVTFDMPSN